MPPVTIRTNHNSRIVGAVIAFIIIVGGGLVLWQANEQSGKQPAAVATPPVVTTRVKDGFLPVPGWNLRLMAVATIKGGYYVGTPKTIDGGKAQQLNFFDAGLDTLKNISGKLCKDSSYPVFTIVRYLQTDAQQIKSRSGQYYLAIPKSAITGQFKFASNYVFKGYVPTTQPPTCATYKTKTTNNLLLPDLNVLQHYHSTQAAYQESLFLAQQL
ncbi:MAG TPA: hypothetical protein VG992_04270 [Candidatus Saccharimonadales bacterium]|nr:hypothetical protein [Candidatus Saccharimonadales bacterium]